MLRRTLLLVVFLLIPATTYGQVPPPGPPWWVHWHINFDGPTFETCCGYITDMEWQSSAVRTVDPSPYGLELRTQRTYLTTGIDANSTDAQIVAAYKTLFGPINVQHSDTQSALPPADRWKVNYQFPDAPEIVLVRKVAYITEPGLKQLWKEAWYLCIADTVNGGKPIVRLIDHTATE